MHPYSNFDVEITSPGYLYLGVVFGSDEYPFYIAQEFNDSFAILIDGENVATLTKNSVEEPFSLQAVEECNTLFRRNNVAPLPSDLFGSGHSIPGAPRYNIEFGGFTAPLTFETGRVLAPGVYTVKLVVQDVSDTRVDAALFIADDGLKLISVPLRRCHLGRQREYGRLYQIAG